MKIKYIIIYVWVMLISMPVKAQEKELTFQDLIPGGSSNYRFIPQNIRQLQWCGDKYMYVRGDSLLTSDPAGKKEQVAFTRKQLNAVLASAGLPETGSMPAFFVPDQKKTEIAFQYKNNRVHYDLATNRITARYEPDKSGSRWEYDKANGNIAYTKENNVYIITPDGRTETVTNETDPGIVCGTSVHQNEFGIHKGLFWAPKGSALAFYRMDESMVTDYPVVHISERTAKAEPFKYPMAGMKSHEVTVGVFRLSDKRTVWLKTGLPKEKYLTNVAWSPDEKSLYIAELNRGQDTCRLVRYSAETGECEAELFVETNERYVEPQQPVRFLPGHAERFIWQSRRDGYNHLYLYDTSGKMLKQLTAGRWAVQEVLGFDETGHHVFFTATAPRDVRSAEEGSPLETYAWKLNMKNGKRDCLNPKEGVHRVQLNVTATYLIDQTSAPATPRDIDIINVGTGRSIRSLLTAKDPYESYRMPDVRVGTLTAADNRTKLYYRLVTPPDMDETKKYPVIVYVYGGPHAQMVTGGWMNGAGGWDLYMARRGYIMFTVDNRGSANRGFEFESVIHRRLGEVEMADQMKGIDFLKSLPYVDTERIGVHGWSYGGFMTTNLMLTHPDVFRVGVAGGPVIDWNRYEIMYGERYMDHPKENPEGYKASDLLNKAGNLKGNLLLIHGDEDPVVVWQHSLLFVKACVDAGTFPDYFVYPGHPHNVVGKDRPHLYEKITRYFDAQLKPVDD
ncbi:MAG: DPP IV N-terminal domain-containing protein [Tannerella sp.]|jgi:dipeptidyl aminopeptidase/acylaminoacyl peptidase|nr:DPP IV N-terminal domain-containing protein [Tannerella sp.]